MVEYKLSKLATKTSDFPRGQWCVHWEENGKRRRYRLALGLDRPRKEAELKLSKFVETRTRALFDADAVTIGELADMYFANRKREGKCVRGMEDQWKANLKPVFAGLKPADINLPVVVRGIERTRCHEYAENRKLAGRRRATIYYELNILRTILNWATNQDPPIKPVRVWLPRRAGPRDSQLTWDEIFAVFAECRAHHHLKLFMLLDIMTTQRKGAILDLTWDQISFERKEINFRKNRDEEDILNTGGQKGRSVVDMGDYLAAALQEAKLFAQSEYVIEWRGNKVGDVKKGLSAAFKRAGITKPFAGAHAIRKSVAGLLADAGEEMRKLQKLLGHEEMETTNKWYAHHSRGYLTSSISLLEAFIAMPRIEPEKEGDVIDGDADEVGHRFDEPGDIEGSDDILS
jgi:integrase